MLRSLSALVLALAAAPAVHAAQWEIDPGHGRVTFSVKHMVISDTEGRFKKFTGTANLDEKDIAKSFVTVEIDPASIDTAEEKRDEHLKSPEFFDVKKFPKMTFKSTKVEKKDAGYSVVGDLTLHGVTKPVTLLVSAPSQEVKDPWGNTRVAFKATSKVNRKDFGLTWNKALETGGVVVGDDVNINIEVELIKKAEAGAKKAEAPAPTKK
jgi:polyisoprenoid-binding protein YceI